MSLEENNYMKIKILKLKIRTTIKIIKCNSEI